MELRLFNRGKDMRLVRPHRVASLEWLRAVRHNIACELILIADEARAKLRERFRQIDETPLPGMAPDWSDRLRQAMNGRRAAERLRSIVTSLRLRGVTPGFWPLFFIVGLLMGVGAKKLAEDHLTIGYEDYKLPQAERLYDFQAIETRLAALDPTDQSLERPEYPACPLQP